MKDILAEAGEDYIVVDGKITIYAKVTLNFLGERSV